MSHTKQESTTLTRRELLRLLAGAGSGLALFMYGGKAFAQSIELPNSSANLPTDSVTFRWLDSGDNKGQFFDSLFAKYQEAYPNITVERDGLPENEISRIVPLGVQNGTAPDVFQVIPNVTTAQMVSEGWIRPLDDVIPNFEAWKKRFPVGVLTEGVTVFDGKVYAFPYISNKQYSTLLFYNVDYMQAAGFDPSETPLTQETFREAAKQMTQKGSGQYYGIIEGANQSGRLSSMIGSLAAMDGAFGGEFNFQTGTYNYTSEAFGRALATLLGMRDDGSFFPGVLQLDAPQARAFFPQGVAGMILQGTWNIPQWARENPEFNFGVSSSPLPTSGKAAPLHYSPGAFVPLLLSADTQHPEIAGDLFDYISSKSGQRAFAESTGGSDRPILTSATEGANLDPRIEKAYALFDEQLRLAPSPVVRNPEAAQVALEQRVLTPNLGEIVQGLFSGQLSDPQAAMQDLQDRADQELDRAIAAAQAKGAKVSREDWVFPNWDPTRDFTDADYDAL